MHLENALERCGGAAAESEVSSARYRRHVMMNRPQPGSNPAVPARLSPAAIGRTLPLRPPPETAMKTRTLASLALAGLLAAGSATARPANNVADPQAPRALAADGPVQVQWNDPAGFTELRQSRNRWEAQRGDWVVQLAQYLRQRAAGQLPEGQQLAVTITDIKRAGDYEPWHGPRLDDVRIMRDIYPPRINLQFTLTDAQGQVIDQGERKLVDSGYLYGGTRLSDTDPLRYEKRMLDDWLHRELREGRSTARL